MRRTFAVAGIVLALFGAAACGSDDDGDAGGATTTAAGGATTTAAAGATTTAASGGATTTAAAGGGGVEEAKATVEKLLEPATSINIDVPLTAAPEEGKKVYWLEGNVEDIRAITEGYKEATAALGWDLTTLTYDTADPQTVNAAMQQAVDQGADYIAVSGQTQANFDQALQNAKAAGIPVIDMYNDSEVGGADGNGIYANIGGLAEVERTSPYMSDWAIADSDGSANVAFFNLPDFKILQVLEAAVEGEFEAACPDCQYEAVDLTINDLVSGGIPSQIVSYVQSNPDVEYIGCAIGQICNGAREALNTAGVGEDVKFFGGNPNIQTVQGLIDDDEQAYLTLPRQASAWNAVDAMARLSLEMDLEPILAADLPRQIWTPENVPTPAQEYQGVEGYQDLWKELWQVGG